MSSAAGSLIPKHFYSFPFEGGFSNFAKSSGVLIKPTALCISPWNIHLQYGGSAACALYSALAAQANQLESHKNSKTTLRCCSLQISFFKPIPQTALFLAPAPPLRVGGKVAHLQASLVGSRSSGEPGEVLGHAIGVFQRSVDLTSFGVSSTPNVRQLEDLKTIPDKPMCATDGSPPRIGGSVVSHYATPGTGFFWGLDCRMPSGGKEGRPITFWSKLQVPLFEGYPIDPIHRMLLVGEGCNGITAVLPLKKFSFVNSSFTATILRPPRSEWVALRGRTEICGETGSGMTVGSMYDEENRGSPCCSVSQPLLVEPWEHVPQRAAK